MKLSALNLIALWSTTAVSVSAFAPPASTRTLKPPRLSKARSASLERTSWVTYSTASPEQETAVDVTIIDTPSPVTQSTTVLGTGIPYAELTIGVLKETFAGENRVSQTPDSVANLIKAGFTVLVQAGGMC